MYLKQYSGPFIYSGKDGKTTVIVDIRPKTNYRYTHIGIQYPLAMPLVYDAAGVDAKKTIIPAGNIEPDITIDTIGSSGNKQFKINKPCVLEFNGLNETAIQISITKSLPMGTIIDIGYDIYQD